jgi:hypothetical protein
MPISGGSMDFCRDLVAATRWGLFSAMLWMAACTGLGDSARTTRAATPAEKPAAPEGLPQTPIGFDDLIKRYDLNGDGKLDEAEIAAVQAKLKSAPPAFARTNSLPYKVTRQDLVEGKGRPKKNAKNPPEDFFQKYDLNKDGQLDAREIEAAKADLSAPHAGKRGPVKTTPAKPVGPKPIPPKKSLIR